MSGVEKVLYGLLLVGRTCVGAVMIYAGAQLLRGDGLLSQSAFDHPMTGIFVILLGVGCLYSGVVGWLLEHFLADDQRRL